MTMHEAYTQLRNDLYFMYDHAESENIAHLVMEKITGLTKSERHLNGLRLLTAAEQNDFLRYKLQLNTGKPVQQVLQEAWFHEMKFYVNEHVLIPRPETDELVEWVTEEIRSKKIKGQKILDVGTGSGCIAILLKKELSDCDVHAIDVSEEALKVAKKNAVALVADVEFHLLDFLDEQRRKSLPVFEYIISNPPYIKKSEAGRMHNNVLDFEPHQALFVDDEDPLLFYRAIVEFAESHLAEFGSLFFEINEELADEVMTLLDEYKYDEIELRSDMQGKDRMIRASFL